MSHYTDGHRYLDGPSLGLWIREQLEGRHMSASLQRRLNAWKLGTRVDFYDLDRHLCSHDLSPCDIPEECWDVDQKRKRGQKKAA